MTDTQPDITDEMLTSYLDDEMDLDLRVGLEAALDGDAELQTRLAGLTVSREALKQGFDTKALGAPAMPAHVTAAPRKTGMGLFWPAAVTASFVLGMAAIPALKQSAYGMKGWVGPIASYQALYVTETLSGAPQGIESTRAMLDRAEALFGVSLEPALNIDGLTFKRVQMLAIDGQPLIQMAYLDDAGVPFAFCVTPRDGAQHPPTTAMSHRLATTSWIADGVGFVLIGGTDETRVAQLSEGLRQQF